jgi:hypothetical protein
MNDLEMLDKYIENTCNTGCVHPALLNDLAARGLVWAVNKLPADEQQAKAVMRARLAKIGKCFGEPEIDQIANNIQRLDALRIKLNTANITDTHTLTPILLEMQEIAAAITNYYK